MEQNITVESPYVVGLDVDSHLYNSLVSSCFKEIWF